MAFIPLLNDESFDETFTDLLLTARENRTITLLANELQSFQDTSLVLQSDPPPLNLYKVCKIFDELISVFPDTERTLGARSELIQDKLFENAVVKIQAH
jgi:hypothetical protein